MGVCEARSMPFGIVTADVGDLHRVLDGQARYWVPLCSSSRENGLRRGGVPGSMAGCLSCCGMTSRTSSTLT
jgi:hypothetical protein